MFWLWTCKFNRKLIISWNNIKTDKLVTLQITQTDLCKNGTGPNAKNEQINMKPTCCSLDNFPTDTADIVKDPRHQTNSAYGPLSRFIFKVTSQKENPRIESARISRLREDGFSSQPTKESRKEGTWKQGAIPYEVWQLKTAVNFKTCY